MDEQIQTIRKWLKSKLDPLRYEHSLSVSFTCMSLAMCHGYDMHRAELAGLLHDCAKRYTDQKLIEKCEKHDIMLTEYELFAPAVIHAKYSVWMAENKFGITDPEILSAIGCHTTGKANMGMLDKILYIADYIEPRRDKAPNLPQIRKMAFCDLDRTMYEILRQTLNYLEKKGENVDPTTRHAYEHFKESYDNPTDVENVQPQPEERVEEIQIQADERSESTPLPIAESNSSEEITESIDPETLVISEEVQPQIPGTTESVQLQPEESTENTQPQIEETGESAQPQVEEISENVQQPEESDKNIQVQTLEIIEDIQQPEGIIENIQPELEEAGESVRQPFEETVESTQQPFEETVGSAQQQVEETVGSAQQPFGETVESAQQQAEEIIEEQPQENDQPKPPVNNKTERRGLFGWIKRER